MKKMAIAASLLLVGIGTSACGGDSNSAPTDASMETFCSTLTSIADDASAEDVAEALTKVGTPSDIPADARAGFEFMVDNAKELEEFDPSDASALEDKFGATDAKNMTAFVNYLVSSCVGNMLPTEIPTQ